MGISALVNHLKFVKMSSRASDTISSNLCNDVGAILSSMELWFDDRIVRAEPHEYI